MMLLAETILGGLAPQPSLPATLCGVVGGLGPSKELLESSEDMISMPSSERMRGRGGWHALPLRLLPPAVRTCGGGACCAEEGFDDEFDEFDGRFDDDADGQPDMGAAVRR